MGQYWLVAKLPMRESRCSIVAGVGGWDAWGPGIKLDELNLTGLGLRGLRGSPGYSSVLI